MSFAKEPPVPTQQHPLVERIHGVDVADPYRWLEDADAPEVRAWTERQNALTRATLDAVPARPAIERRLWSLFEIGSLGAPVVRRRTGGARRYFYARRDGKQNQPVLYARDGVSGTDHVVVDVNQLASDGTRSLDWWFPSEDGALVAYGVSENGSEESILRVRDVAGASDRPDEIPRTRACSLAWLPDGAGFYYTRYPAPGSVPAGDERYHRSVFFHHLGDDPARDRPIFGQGRDLKDWPGVDLSPDGRWLVITVEQGWSRSEIHLIDRHAQNAQPVPVAVGVEARFSVVQALSDRIYLQSDLDAPRGRIFRVDPRQPARARWTVAIPETKDNLQGATYLRGHLAAHYLVDASSRLRLFTEEGRPDRELALPALGQVTALTADRDGDELFYSFTSFLAPTTVFRHSSRGATGAGVDPVWRAIAAPVDAGRYAVEQVWFTSPDGTRCPMFLVQAKNGAPDQSRPTVLYGYGGFNVDILPAWSPAIIPLLEAGGVYAVATLRGGGEYGETWHRAGMLEKKQNVFDDFIAAARWLIENKITSPARLAALGRSNGGLLVGAAITQRPDLFRAAVAGVPLLDMVRYHKFRLAQLWIPEYGSADDATQFKWLYAYSPYHRVKDGVAYPAVLITTADSDTRVDPLHARKMTARLQAASSGSHPVLLRLESKAGHGAGKPLAATIAQLADEWAFLFAELGVPVGPQGAPR
ncbi:MAG TPA: prolyl oligopeptidase family serine peptidase [Polyangia bacterium]|nr:prolyl oligopeptidase family serine peptidase [Polyangia bacterium]